MKQLNCWFDAPYKRMHGLTLKQAELKIGNSNKYESDYFKSEIARNYKVNAADLPLNTQYHPI